MKVFKQSLMALAVMSIAVDTPYAQRAGGAEGSGPRSEGANARAGGGARGGNGGGRGGNGGARPGAGAGNGGARPGAGNGNGGARPGAGNGNGGARPGAGNGNGGARPGNGANRPDRIRDNNGNIRNDRAQGRVQEANRRGSQRRNDQRVVRVTNHHTNIYVNNYRTTVVNRYTYVNNYRNYGHSRYVAWHSHGFRGGFYWSVRPYYDINTYYWNPSVAWLYISDWDDHYYRSWYESDYDRYMDLRRPYRHVGIFYPTEEIRDLSVDVSMMYVSEQINYRRGLEVLGDRLQSELSSRTYGTARLGRYDVVVNNYQILPGDTGVVVEGYVAHDRAQFPFKALLDLREPSFTRVFVPDAWDGYGSPNSSKLYELRMLNERIEYLGGWVDYN